MVKNIFNKDNSNNGIIDYKLIADNTYDCEVYRDKDLKLVYVSPSFERLTGYKVKDVLTGNINFKYFTEKESIPIVEKMLNDVLKGNSINDKEFKVLRKDNKEVWVSISSNPVKDNFGKVIGIRSSIRDINDKKTEEEKLKKSEERYKNLADNLDEALFLLGIDKRFIYINSIAEKMFKMPRDKIIGKTFYDIFPKNIADIQEKSLISVIKNGKKYELEQHSTYKGETRWYHTRLCPIKDENDKVTSVLIIAKDITHKKNYEEKLKDSEEKYRELIDNADDQILLIDKDYRYLSVNKKLASTLNKKPEEIIGKTVNKVYPKNQVALFVKNLDQVFKNGKNLNIDETINLPSGQIWVNSTLTPIKDDFGNVKYIIGIVRDISEKKKVEDVLIKKNQEIEFILDSVPAMVFYKDTKNNMIKVNNEFSNAMGLSKNKIEGKNSFEIWPKKQAEEYWNDDKYVINTGRPKIGIIEKMPSSEGIRWVKTDKIPFRDNDGNVNGIVGFATDITNQKGAEEALTESKNFLNSIIQNIPDMIFVKDSKDFKFEEMNHAGEKLLGLQKEKILGKTLLERFSKKQSDFFLEKDREVIKSGKLLDIPEESINTPAGLRILHTKKIPLFDEKGNPKHLLGISEDITDRKNAEEKIKESEEKYKGLFEGSKDPIMTLELPSGRFTSVNKAALELFNVKSEKEFLTLTPADITPKYQPEGELSSEKIKKMNEIVLKKGSNYFEWLHKKLNGEEFYASVLLSKIKIGDRILLQANVRDITEKKIIEDELSFKTNLLETQSETTPEGILIVDINEKIIFSNKNFVNMWEIPDKTLKTNDDKQIIGSVINKLENPDEFIEKVKYLYIHKDEKSHDIINLKNKKYFERYSVPLFGKNNEYLGRIWYFKDISEQKTAENEIISKSQELEKFNQFAVGRELKMIELKKEINELLMKLNEKPKYGV